MASADPPPLPSTDRSRTDPPRRLEATLAQAAASMGTTPALAEAVADLYDRAGVASLGADPEAVVALLTGRLGPGDRVLDLGCAAGLVAVALASALGVGVDGVDGLAGFVDAARRRAAVAGLHERCRFAHGDLHDALAAVAAGNRSPYDAVLLAAVGPVLGDVAATMAALRRAVRPGGWILLTDAYRRADTDTETGTGETATGPFGSLPTLAALRQALTAHGDDLAGEVLVDPGDLAASRAADRARLQQAAAVMADEARSREDPELAEALLAYVAPPPSDPTGPHGPVGTGLWLLQRR